MSGADVGAGALRRISSPPAGRVRTRALVPGSRRRRQANASAGPGDPQHPLPRAVPRGSRYPKWVARLVPPVWCPCHRIGRRAMRRPPSHTSGLLLEPRDWPVPETCRSTGRSCRGARVALRDLPSRVTRTGCAIWRCGPLGVVREGVVVGGPAILTAGDQQRRNCRPVVDSGTRATQAAVSDGRPRRGSNSRGEIRFRVAGTYDDPGELCGGVERALGGAGRAVQRAEQQRGGSGRAGGAAVGSRRGARVAVRRASEERCGGEPCSGRVSSVTGSGRAESGEQRGGR